ncbi:hypothetical protein BSIN_5064 [Burkholderia singularis]|uniref:Uncharacterized protein n=1 Tax=Burkholderia singularis TaxID=1503053 RepID=A0A238HBQ1_9BURK|nr:hypothetical protein BSIN_5064 [Burkholderia singularis]
MRRVRCHDFSGGLARAKRQARRQGSLWGIVPSPLAARNLPFGQWSVNADAIKMRG